MEPNEEMDDSAAIKAFFKSAYDTNGKVKTVTAAALKAVSQLEQESATRIGKYEASRPPRSPEDIQDGLSIGLDTYQGAIADDSNPQAVFLRNGWITTLKMAGVLSDYAHDGILDDKVYEVAANFPMDELPNGPFLYRPMNPETFIAALKALGK